MLWKKPEAGERYVIGIDTSTGVSTDYTVMQVLSARLPFEQVAKFRAKWSVVDCGKFANDLGRYYNTALIVVETNYPGNAVQDALVQQYQYPRNYKAEEHLDEAPNISSKFGFQTTQASKWLLIREMQHALQNDDLVINDRTTLEELGSYVYIEDRTKTGAAPGLNDDCVMALMLAYHGALLYPQKPKPKILKPSDECAQQRSMMNRFLEGIISNQKRKVEPL
ncbi:MAG: hypothetical protein LLF76_02795 [Planctomycetaceae bacterium]|nr:hypothetical protein [Planctomycetaceae bacterium]